MEKRSHFRSRRRRPWGERPSEVLEHALLLIAESFDPRICDVPVVRGIARLEDPAVDTYFTMHIKKCFFCWELFLEARKAPGYRMDMLRRLGEVIQCKEALA